MNSHSSSANFVKTAFKLLRTNNGTSGFEILHDLGQRMPVSQDNTQFGERMPMGQCYANSMHTSLVTGLHYCEGYACSGAIGQLPIQHAWLCDENGHVIDPTWEDGFDYFGIAFTQDFLTHFMAETKYYGVLCNLFLLGRKPNSFFKNSGHTNIYDYLKSGIAQITIDELECL